MNITTVAVLGGSGFVGRHVCAALAAAGYRVRVASRDRERAKVELILLPTVDVDYVDVHDGAALREFLHGTDAAVNLIGVLQPGRGRTGFEEAHVGIARKLVAACREAGVRRLLHMSALNADPAGPSAYLRSKGEAERVVRDSGLAWTLFRPSVIFGRGDGFLNLFAALLRIFPVLPLGSPGARFQPVWVEDVARAFAAGLGDLCSHGASYDLCGPKVYTLRELVEHVGAVTGRRRPVVGLGDALSQLQAAVMGVLPWKLLTLDNYNSMKVDSVCSCEFPFGIVPAALEAIAPSYLGHRTPRARYMEMRSRAHRQVQGG